MGRIVKAALGLALAVATAGCASTSYSVPADKPVAWVTMSRAELPAVLGNYQDAKFYHRGHHTGSTAPKSAAWSSIADYVYDTPLPVEADVRSVIMVDVRISLRSWTAYCARNLAFTPKAGRTYRFTPRASGEDQCTVAVVDTQTGAAPEDLALMEQGK